MFPLRLPRLLRVLCLPRILPFAACLGLLPLGGSARADVFDRSPGAPAPASSEPVHVFLQLGTGLVELANAKAGVFLGRHLSVEAMAAWDGVYDSRFGGGITGIFGHASGARPPRHALLVGARVMLNRAVTFDSAGEDLSSYVVLPVGYGYLSHDGFYLTATLGPTFTRERGASSTLESRTTHHLAISGALFNLAAGLAF